MEGGWARQTERLPGEPRPGTRRGLDIGPRAFTVYDAVRWRVVPAPESLPAESGRVEVDVEAVDGPHGALMVFWARQVLREG